MLIIAHPTVKLKRLGLPRVYPCTEPTQFRDKGKQHVQAYNSTHQRENPIGPGVDFTSHAIVYVSDVIELPRVVHASPRMHWRNSERDDVGNSMHAE